VAFADDEKCAPLSLIGSASPFATGAFAINFESGGAMAPPASWSSPPSWCAGHWVSGGITFA
jgi:hypothetical protein